MGTTAQQPRLLSTKASYIPMSMAELACVTQTHTFHEDDSGYSTDSTLSSPRSDQGIRLVQWNIHGWRDTHHKDNFDATLEAVQLLRPDVLVLNEVLHPYRLPHDSERYTELVRSGQGKGYTAEPVPEEGSYLHRLSVATGLTHYYFGEAVSDGYFGEFGYGNAILSRYELHHTKHTLLKADQFKYGEGRRIEAEDRCIVSAVVSADSPVRVVTSHLDQLDEALRTQQARMIIEEMSNAPGSILVGDLNTYQASDYSSEGWQAICALWAKKGWGLPPTDSSTLKALSEAGLVDSHYLANRNANSYARPTCWTIEPLFRIDYALFDRQSVDEWCVEACDCEMRATCSDHFPIVLDLTHRLPKPVAAHS